MTGLLSLYFRQAEEGSRISLPLFTQTLTSLICVTQMVLHFELKFSPTKVQEFSGSQLVLKIDQPDDSQAKTIGNLYAFTEKMRAANGGDFAIKEFAAAQTTLEQIFNTFAKENEVKRFNMSVR